MDSYLITDDLQYRGSGDLSNLPEGVEILPDSDKAAMEAAEEERRR